MTDRLQTLVTRTGKPHIRLERIDGLLFACMYSDIGREDDLGLDTVLVDPNATNHDREEGVVKSFSEALCIFENGPF